MNKIVTFLAIFAIAFPFCMNAEENGQTARADEKPTELFPDTQKKRPRDAYSCDEFELLYGVNGITIELPENITEFRLEIYSVSEGQIIYKSQVLSNKAVIPLYLTQGTYLVSVSVSRYNTYYSYIEI
jgi:hypothetical protein